MFDKKEYREVFSQVTASPDTYRRVMEMKTERKRTYAGRGLARAVLVATVLMLVALSAAASESVQNWFIDFFSGMSRDGLSSEQVQYIEENTQTILDKQTIDGWTVELHSAIRNERKAYIVFRIEGPEDVDLSNWTDETGNLRGQLLFGNDITPAYVKEIDSFFDIDENIERGGWGYYWMDDGDDKAYTENLVFFLEPMKMQGDLDPFGENTVYHFRFQDIVWYWQDLDYRYELWREKYAGQDVIEYTKEELQKLHRFETLAEGVWEFEISFGQLKYVEGELLAP